MSTTLIVALVAGMFGLFGSISAVIVASVLKKKEAREASALKIRENQIATMVSLFRDWHDNAISEARIHANALLGKEWNGLLRNIDQRHPDNFKEIWMIMEFFARLHAEIKLGTITKDDIPGVFGEQIVWWWIVHFSGKAVPGEMCSYDAMEALNVWLEGFCKGSIYEDEHKKWLAIANAARERLWLSRAALCLSNTASSQSGAVQAIL